MRHIGSALVGALAAAAVDTAVLTGFEASTDRLGDAIYPPSPCFSA